jgi:hypothetical protein
MSKKHIILFALILLSTVVLVLIFAEQRGTIFLAKLTILVATITPILFFILGKIVSTNTRKKILTNLILLTITTTICFIVAELFVRHLFDDVTTTEDNSSYFAKRWLKLHPPSINKSGFREREYSLQKVADTYRIVVIGDSFTYGQGIIEDARFTNIVQHHLNAQQANYEVLNFGRPGAETIDHIGFLDQYIFELNPDFILLQWFVNDVEGDNKTGRPQPNRLIPSDYLSDLLHKNSALFYLINTKWNQLQTKMGLVESYEDSMLKRFGDHESKDSRRASRELDKFILRIKEKNIPMGIVMFPPLVETGGLIEAYPYSFLFDRVTYACQRHAIECLDLRPVFAQISPASKLWANQFDSHPGPLANKLAAKAILGMILNNEGNSISKSVNQ